MICLRLINNKEIVTTTKSLKIAGEIADAKVTANVIMCKK